MDVLEDSAYILIVKRSVDSDSKKDKGLQKWSDIEKLLQRKRAFPNTDWYWALSSDLLWSTAVRPWQLFWYRCLSDLFVKLLKKAEGVSSSDRFKFATDTQDYPLTLERTSTKLTSLSRLQNKQGTHFLVCLAEYRTYESLMWNSSESLRWTLKNMTSQPKSESDRPFYDFSALFSTLRIALCFHDPLFLYN